MSTSKLCSYFTPDGALTCLHPLSDAIDAVVSCEDTFPGFCRSGAMIEFGSLGVLRFICSYAKIPTPVLNSVTSSQGAFGVCLKRISDFYSDPNSNKPITSEDAFHLLRLHVHGGGLNRWRDGLKSGVFVTQDGVVIGRTEPKSAIKLEKDAKGRWERPPWLHSFSSEMTKVCDRLSAINIERICELCPDVDSAYQRQSRFINHLINLVQVSIMHGAVDHIASLGGTDIETTPSTYRWRGIPSANGVLFDELSRYANPAIAWAVLKDGNTLGRVQCGPTDVAVPVLTFGPIAMPTIAPLSTTPFTKASVFATLGKRKTTDSQQDPAVPGP